MAIIVHHTEHPNNPTFKKKIKAFKELVEEFEYSLNNAPIHPKINYRKKNWNKIQWSITSYFNYIQNSI